MNFSVYNDAWESSDGSTLYNSVSVADNSSGCYHCGYTTTAGINSPDGRVASTDTFGLSSETSMLLEGISGTYNVYANTRYSCSCIGQGGAGGGEPYPVPPKITNLSPSADYPLSGRQVTISGTGFGTTPSVSIDGVSSVSITNSSNTSITVTFDATGLAPGGHNVIVTSNGLSSTPVALIIMCVGAAGETSTYRYPNWVDGEWANYYAGVFKVLVSPNPQGASLFGRGVKETNYGTVDNCHFDGSSFASVTDAQSLGGGTWAINTDNTYGDDYIGIRKDFATYYGGAISAGSTAYQSCSVAENQDMALSDCLNTYTYVYYQTNVTGNTITADSVSAQRGNASGAAK